MTALVKTTVVILGQLFGKTWAAFYFKIFSHCRYVWAQKNIKAESNNLTMKESLVWRTRAEFDNTCWVLKKNTFIALLLRHKWCHNGDKVSLYVLSSLWFSYTLQTTRAV